MRTLLSAIPFLLLPLASAQEAAPRLPPPEQIAIAERKCHDAFATDYADGVAARRAAFAQRLADAAGGTSDDPAMRYVLLRDSARIAAEVGDADASLTSIAALAGAFPVDRWQLSLTHLKLAGKAAAPTEDRYTHATRLLAVADGALAAEQFDLSDEAAREAQAVASNIRGHSTQLKTLSAALDERAALCHRWRAASAELASRPDDARATGTVGKLICAVRQDWSLGLARFAKSGDPALMGIASKEAAMPASARDMFDLASAWWDLAQTEVGRVKDAFCARAAHWYSAALPGLPPVEQAIARKRVPTATADATDQKAASPAEAEEDTAAAKPKAKPAPDDQLQLWPVGTKVTGWRVNKNGCPMEGQVVHSDAERLEIRLEERMPRKVRTYRWVFERTRIDARTGECFYAVKDAVLMPADNAFRTNFRGTMAIKDGVMTGWYQFDYGDEKPDRQDWRLEIVKARPNDQLQFWPVGTRVEGKRDIATLKGVVTRSDDTGVEFELEESWIGARGPRKGQKVSFKVRWVFERTKLNPRTGDCSYTLKGGSVIGSKDDRSNYRGTMTIRDDGMAGKYAFDFGNTKVEDVEQVWELRVVQ